MSPECEEVAEPLRMTMDPEESLSAVARATSPLSSTAAPELKSISPPRAIPSPPARIILPPPCDSLLPPVKVTLPAEAPTAAPVWSEMLPERAELDAPDVFESPEPTSKDPLPPEPPRPLETSKLPPVPEDAPDSSLSIEPVALPADLPAMMPMFPASPLDSPVIISRSPDSTPATPDPRRTSPLRFVSKEVAENTSTPPLILPDPLATLTFPPTSEAEFPARIFTDPPLSWVLGPAASDMDPPAKLDAPTSSRTEPA